MTALLLVLVLLLASNLCSVVGQTHCTTPNGKGGDCMSIYSCSSLLKITSNPTPTQVMFLRNSFCGFNGSNPKVCCPKNDCTTPDGAPGTCIGFFSCPHLVNMLRQNPTQEWIQYEQSCQSSEQYSVCCRSEDTSTETQSQLPINSINARSSHKCQLTAFPPDPNTDCCGTDTGSGIRILGGTAAAIDQFPWLVMIDYSREGFSCGGSLISGRYVLTAAHCLVGSEGKSREVVGVRLGEFNATNPGQDCVSVAGGGTECTDGAIFVPMESFVIHNGYANEQVLRYHDIGLIRLQEIVSYTDFIRPICLPSSDFTLNAPDDMKFYISGWGISDETQQHSSDIKLFAKVPYVKREQCNERYSRLQRQLLVDSQVCVGGEGNRDPCKGDSGGPLMHLRNFTYEVVGVVSFGTKICGLENWPNIYTKVYDYLDWINDNIKP